jgi:hypothetical protein
MTGWMEGRDLLSRCVAYFGTEFVLSENELTRLAKPLSAALTNPEDLSAMQAKRIIKKLNYEHRDPFS